MIPTAITDLKTTSISCLLLTLSHMCSESVKYDVQKLGILYENVT